MHLYIYYPGADMIFIEWIFRFLRSLGAATLTVLVCIVLGAVIGWGFHLSLIASLILVGALACVALLTFNRPTRIVREFSDDPKDWGTSEAHVVRIARALDLYPEDPEEEEVEEKLLYAGRREHPVNMFWIVLIDLVFALLIVYISFRYGTFHLRYHHRYARHNITLHGWWLLGLLVLPAFWLTKAYLTWRSRFFVVTTLRIGLVVAPDRWVWFINDYTETFWLKDVRQIDLVRPWWVKLIGIDSGTVCLDTPSSIDQRIHDMPAVWRAKLIVEDIWRATKTMSKEQKAAMNE